MNNTAYSNILSAIKQNSPITKELFNNFIATVNGESIFELNQTEIQILEFIRSQGRKFSLKLELIQENPKNGEVIKTFTPKEKITADLLSYKYCPYQFIVSLK
ncbi:hypothetical protein IRT38_00065 (plasmid) [Acinetobacter sp. SK-43]|uniref:hypothetical protein n=1 Tax=Pseudomonadota TaxID=1224 RepID=UPI0012C0E681|nr:MULTISPECIES: hypothetical protein [Pseudomonadota]MBF4453807.1 hypothetical protein [Acinetobacter sp. SK-43]MPS92745.1 hypothetical protein [Comamonas sp.]